MNNLKINKVLVEYYETVSNILHYESDSKTEKLSDEILGLLLAIFKADDTESNCRKMIISADCIQTLADIVLIKNDKDMSNNAATEIKVSVLKKAKIEQLTPFDIDMLALKTQKAALEGDRGSCKLWACMNWLGTGVAENKNTAIEIWKQLAVCGEKAAVAALIYGYADLGNAIEEKKWETVSQILEMAFDNFAPIAFPVSADGECLSCIEMANLILAMQERMAREKSDTYINRSMAYYALYGMDKFNEKLKNISCETDFCSLLWNGQKSRTNTIGFCGGD